MSPGRAARVDKVGNRQERGAKIRITKIKSIKVVLFQRLNFELKFTVIFNLRRHLVKNFIFYEKITRIMKNHVAHCPLSIELRSKIEDILTDLGLSILAKINTKNLKQSPGSTLKGNSCTH